MVTDRYRYAEWIYQNEPVVELYDLKEDPWETINLAGNADSADVRAEMAALLKSGWKSVVPQTDR